MDNLISGTGEIGQQLQGSGVGTFINEARGVIDANDASGPLVIAGVGPDTNAGLIEATQGGTLLIDGVTIDNFLNHTKGTVEAGHDSTVGLGGWNNHRRPRDDQEWRNGRSGAGVKFDHWGSGEQRRNAWR